MIKRPTLYCCSNCHKICLDPGKMFLADQYTSKGFCTDECILEYYAPSIEFFEKVEVEQRKVLGHKKTEACARHREQQHLIHQCLETPDEVWEETTRIGEHYFTLIKRFNRPDVGEFWMLMISFFYADRPSFVLFQTVTADEKLVDFYRVGSVPAPVVNNPTDNDGEVLELGPDQIQEIEAKKSFLLAEVLEVQEPDDIKFEEYPTYDFNLQDTLEAPDEIYEWSDKAGDQILTYVKSFSNGSENYFYFVVGQRVPEMQADQQEMDIIIPILTFPSKKQRLCQLFKRGQLVSGMLKS